MKKNLKLKKKRTKKKKTNLFAKYLFGERSQKNKNVQN